MSEERPKSPLYFDNWYDLYITRVPARVIARLNTLERLGLKKWIPCTYALSKLLERDPFELFQIIQKWHLKNMKELSGHKKKV